MSERADRLKERWEVKEQVKDKWRGRDLFKGGRRVTVQIRELSRAGGTESEGKKE